MKTNPNAIIFPNGGIGVTDPPDGLTKREYFAVMAMQGYLASGRFLHTAVAAEAVLRADDLIEVLNLSKE